MFLLVFFYKTNVASLATPAAVLQPITTRHLRCYLVARPVRSSVSCCLQKQGSACTHKYCGKAGLELCVYGLLSIGSSLSHDSGQRAVLVPHAVEKQVGGMRLTSTSELLDLVLTHLEHLVVVKAHPPAVLLLRPPDVMPGVRVTPLVRDHAAQLVEAVVVAAQGSLGVVHLHGFGALVLRRLGHRLRRVLFAQALLLPALGLERLLDVVLDGQARRLHPRLQAVAAQGEDVELEREDALAELLRLLVDVLAPLKAHQVHPQVLRQPVQLARCLPLRVPAELLGVLLAVALHRLRQTRLDGGRLRVHVAPQDAERALRRHRRLVLALHALHDLLVRALEQAAQPLPALFALQGLVRGRHHGAAVLLGVLLQVLAVILLVELRPELAAHHDKHHGHHGLPALLLVHLVVQTLQRVQHSRFTVRGRRSRHLCVDPFPELGHHAVALDARVQVARVLQVLQTGGLKVDDVVGARDVLNELGKLLGCLRHSLSAAHQHDGRAGLQDGLEVVALLDLLALGDQLLPRARHAGDGEELRLDGVEVGVGIELHLVDGLLVLHLDLEAHPASVFFLRTRCGFNEVQIL
eukprot:Rhum_TRINITY_DN20963_c0_g1::Rhum_TRINITY_DN20963_c0_g1_i1::g.172729::m.172729